MKQLTARDWFAVIMALAVVGWTVGERMLNKGLAERTAERDRLRAALAEAIEEVESWGAYASEYFQDKHDLQGTLKRLRAALAGRK